MAPRVDRMTLRVKKPPAKVTTATKTRPKTKQKTKLKRKTNENLEALCSNSLQEQNTSKDSELPAKTGLTKHHVYAIIWFDEKLYRHNFGVHSERSDEDKEYLLKIAEEVDVQEGLKTYIENQTIQYPLRSPHMAVLGTHAWFEAGLNPDKADPQLPRLPDYLQLPQGYRECSVQDQKWLKAFVKAEYKYIIKIRDWLLGLFSNFCRSLDHEFGKRIMDEFRERLNQAHPRVVAELIKLPIDSESDWKIAHPRMKLATLKKLDELICHTLSDIEDVQHEIHVKTAYFQTVTEEWSFLAYMKPSAVEQYQSRAIVDNPLRQNNFLGYPKTPLDFTRQQPDEAREFVDKLMQKQYQKHMEDYRQYWEIIVSYHVNRSLESFAI